MHPFGEEPICTCPDTVWEFRLLVDGELVHSARVDCNQDRREERDIQWETTSVSVHHVALAEKAEAAGKTWTTEFVCPSCGGGGRLTATGSEIIKPNL